MTDHLPADGLPEDTSVLMALEVSVGSGYVGEDGQDVVYLSVLGTEGEVYTIVIPAYVALITAAQMAALCVKQSHVAGLRQSSTKEEN